MDNPEAPESRAGVQEAMWIEIIKRMESMYAELANSLSQVERRSKELQEAKEFIDSILNSMADALIVADSLGIVKMANKTTFDILGYQSSEIIGKPLRMLFPDEDAARDLLPGGSGWNRLLQTGSLSNVEVVCSSRSGEPIPMTFSGSVGYGASGGLPNFVLVGKDLREMKKLLSDAAAAEAERAKAAELERAYNELQKLQTQLIRSERLALIGQLAAGVAHEINNPLGGILIYSHLLLEDSELDDTSRSNINRIANEATRCKEIVRGLLDFARQREPKTKPTDVGELIRDTLSLVQGQALFQNIKVTTDIESKLPQIDLDVSQIQQVFMNIIINAAEAMAGKGKLSVTARVSDDPQCVDITFTDTGCGIGPENIERLFEPFFTTKEVGRGTGLGLAVSYGIVEKHGGKIEVQSEVGAGTAFTVRLPFSGKEC